MDRSRFTDDMTGRLVEISVDKPDWAFIPAPLPPREDFSGKLWPLLVAAKEALGRLDGIGRTLPDPWLLLRPLQDREALRSSSLEGTFATAEELLLYEMDPREPKSADDAANAWREVYNYGQALRHGRDLLEELPLCLRVIRELHRSLLRGVRGRDRDPGQFRKHQVYIGSDRRYIPPPPNEVDECLDAFEKHLHEEDDRFDPLVRCYLCHYQFEAIHPFADGNGRVGRLLLALMTYKWCDLKMPWLYMSAFFETYKDEYFDAMFQVSTKGDWETWTEFCLRGTVEQAKDAAARCDKLLSLRTDFHQRVRGGSNRDHDLVEGLFSSPMLTVPATQERFNVSYPTAQSDIERLVKSGILTEMARRRPRTFYAADIFRIAYSDETHQ